MANVAEQKQPGVADFILMDNCQEDNFVKNIKERFNGDAIYTNIGSVIVSVNPYKKVKDIYSEQMMTAYRGNPSYGGKLMPHIYSLADEAYNNMKSKREDQVVIISGESGAGKTEASKVVMNYLAFVSGSGAKVDHVKEQLLSSNPVMEAFGNAKTNRNDNSSRFGKYMDIQFNYRGDPVGGNITTYLLEKSRVVKQQEGERNFHIFHQLIQSDLAASVDLKNDPKLYKYLPETTNKGVNDKQEWEDVQKGLNVLGFDKEKEQLEIWSVLAGILHLGNIEFVEDEQGHSQVKNQPELNSCAKLLKVKPEDLALSLTNSTIIANQKPITSPISVEKSTFSRDSLAKALYERLFQHIVIMINKAINAKKEDESSCVFGVLDIYGFEIFEVNGFEQFCINYCNEKLQQLFIELTLKTEQEEYKAEGIEWKDIKYFNNAIICNLIDQKHGGILSTLQEECTRPGDTTDKTWLDKMNTTIGKHERYNSRGLNPKDKTIGYDQFLLKHFAGDVMYTTAGFLEKSNDTMLKDLSKSMFESKSTMISPMFPEGDSTTWTGATKRPTTAGTAFKNSMYKMIDILNTKQPSYIRCIKPNGKKMCGNFEDKLVAHQVAYLGLVENVRVRRAGYCFRTPYDVFLRRYGMTAKATWPLFKGEPKEGTIKILEEHGIKKEEYELGKTKLFFKSPPTVFKFEELREKMLPTVVCTLQQVYRSYKIRSEINGYQDAIKASHGDVLNAPSFGKHIPWPKEPKVLEDAAKMVRAVFLNWWARKTVETIAQENLGAIRLKTLGAHFFGKKKSWDPKRSWVGDYLPERKAKIDETLTKAGSKEAIFVDYTEKINSGGGVDCRIVVLSSTHLIKLNTNCVLDRPNSNAIALADITGVKMSPYSDQFLVVNTKNGQDMVLNIGYKDNEEKLSEIVSRLYLATERKITVEIGEKNTFNNSHNKNAHEKTLTYQKGAACKFLSGKGKTWVVSYA